MPKKNPIFAKRNAIKARNARKLELANPENLEKALDEIVTRIVAVTTTLTKAEMGGEDDPGREFKIVRPMVRATIAEALARRLEGHLPELELKAGLPTERVALTATPKKHYKPWRGALTAAHVDRFGERVCPGCDMRILLGETVVVPLGGQDAYHEACAPEATVDAGHGVKVLSVAERHFKKRPDNRCQRCALRFQIGDRAAWRFGWPTMLHEACWLELGKPEALK